jgi:hypothetical protein
MAKDKPSRVRLFVIRLEKVRPVALSYKFDPMNRRVSTRRVGDRRLA